LQRERRKEKEGGEIERWRELRKNYGERRIEKQGGEIKRW
jgi:hypothetical protein